MGTDGVWDNLYLEQIQKILENCSSPLEAAREIGDEALHYCMDV
jgi:serine/threonine protein phosphatase PrpC